MVNSSTRYLKHLSKVDKRLGIVIKSVGDYTIKTRTDPFQFLTEAIVFQQLGKSAAAAIYFRFLQQYKDISPTPERILVTPNEILRSKVGLSAKKIEYLKDLSYKITLGQLDLSSLTTKTDEQVATSLMQVKGIGRWTVDMFLIFCLGRPDVFPIGDQSLKRAMMKVYCLEILPVPATMQGISQAWKPYRSVATWYLWKSLSQFDSIG